MKDNPIKIQTWIEVESEIKKLHPLLANIINESEISSSTDFVRATYTYGQLIMKNGELQLPLSPTTVAPISDDNILSNVKNRLDGHMPVGIILNKAAELFHEPNIGTLSVLNQVFSEKIMQKGDFIGINDFFDTILGANRCDHNKHISAGARTLFMLPKLSDYNSHHKLRNLTKIHTDLPLNIWEHYNVFKKIATSTITEEKWTIEILFFSKTWWLKKNQKASQPIKDLLLQKAWQQSYYLRKAMSLEPYWGLLVNLNKELIKKRYPILIHTAKKLLAIQAGITPGYIPIVNNTLGPIDLFQKAYIELYKIKYYPTILGPAQLTASNPSVYYSSHLSTLEYQDPSSRHEITARLDFSELSELMNDLIYPNGIKNKFSYFHPKEYTTSGEIKTISELLDLDKNFLPSEDKSLPKLGIATNGPFFKGCIRICY